MTEPRIPLALLPAHFEYIMNVLGTAALRYVDVAPILQDISQQRQATLAQETAEVPAGKANGAADPAATVQ